MTCASLADTVRLSNAVWIAVAEYAVSPDVAPDHVNWNELPALATFNRAIFWISDTTCWPLLTVTIVDD